MAAVATREHSVAEHRRADNAPSAGDGVSRLFEPGGATLEDSILGVWEELVASGRAECPVCGASMSVAGGCPACGSELS